MLRHVLFITAWLMTATPGLADTRPTAPWLSLSGTALNPSPTFFTLDYGKGEVRVAMAGWPWFRGKGNGLIGGKQVIVHGRMDENFAENGTLEATSLYVEGLGTRAHAGKTSPVPFKPQPPVRIGEVEVYGHVSDIRGSEISLGTDSERISVDTGALNAPQRAGLEKGDPVRVQGQMLQGKVDSLELRASTLTRQPP